MYTISQYCMCGEIGYLSCLLLTKIYLTNACFMSLNFSVIQIIVYSFTTNICD